MGLDALVPEVVKGLIEIFVPMIAAGLVWLVVQLARKVGWSISADQQAALKIAAQDLILRYEELAATMAKTAAVPAGFKINGAVADLIAKFPGLKLTPDQARAIIEAELPKIGIGAAAVAKALREAQLAAKGSAPAPVPFP